MIENSSPALPMLGKQLGLDVSDLANSSAMHLCATME
jgi:hypothetical protein